MVKNLEIRILLKPDANADDLLNKALEVFADALADRFVEQARAQIAEKRGVDINTIRPAIKPLTEEITCITQSRFQNIEKQSSDSPENDSSGPLQVSTHNKKTFSNKNKEVTQ